MKKNLVGLILIGVVPLLASMGIRGAEAGSADLDRRLIDAALNGETSKVTKLLLLGADVNAVNQSGKTPLILAAEWHRPATVSMLLDKGADPFIKDHQGKMALDLAKTDKIKKRIQEAMKKETIEAIMDAQSGVPEEIAKLITDITYGAPRSSIEDVD